ncbi:class I SAM-dependent methyltransferase [Halalkalibacillus halophilus]|uniref:class I SAM-dependent methyltransferase n=1 Tax=Halalkalibacillus halophilus TaxID=392827 RepID=UPI00040300C1|nr:class I SAM-dependent methyltransferase [Halalkalibacillus halophilus]
MEQQINQLFEWLDQTSTTIEKKEDVPYIEAVIASSQLLFENEIPENLEPSYEKELQDKLKEIKLEDFPLEVRRKAMQLVILKGMKGFTQQQHYITPDTIGMFIGYLVQKFMDGKKSFRMFDPACGSANLLLTLLNQLKDVDVKAFGSEVDPTLIRLAFNHTNLQERQIEYFHQDSLKPILLEPVDLVVADLPIGFYPDDENASQYDLKAEEGHSFAHHLFIEQSLKYTNPEGYLFFIVPSFLFESEQKDQLQSFLKKHAHINAVLELPDTMFKDEKLSKSILVLQKKGEETKDPNQVMLAQLPSFKDVHAMNGIMKQMEDWFKNERLS